MAFPCVQVGRKCGINMIFKIIDRMEPLSSAPWLTKCIMKCSCDNDNFIENKGKCVKIFDDRITISSSQQSSNQLVSQFSCKSMPKRTKATNAFLLFLLFLFHIFIVEYTKTFK